MFTKAGFWMPIYQLCFFCKSVTKRLKHQIISNNGIQNLLKNKQSTKQSSEYNTMHNLIITVKHGTIGEERKGSANGRPPLGHWPTPRPSADPPSAIGRPLQEKLFDIIFIKKHLFQYIYGQKCFKMRFLGFFEQLIF